MIKPCHECGMFSYGAFPCRWCEVMAENPEPPERDPVDLKDLSKSIQELRSTFRFWLALVLYLIFGVLLSLLALAAVLH